MLFVSGWLGHPWGSCGGDRSLGARILEAHLPSFLCRHRAMVNIVPPIIIITTPKYLLLKLHLKFELTATNGCGDIDVQSYFVRAKSAKLAFWPFLSLHKIVFFPSHTSILAEVTHVYANIHIPKFHTCQPSRFRDMMVQSFKKRQFFNQILGKKLSKKFS